MKSWILNAAVGCAAGAALWALGTPVWLGLALLGGALVFRGK